MYNSSGAAVRAHELLSLLSSPLASSIIHAHPNDLAFQVVITANAPQLPPEWNAWWQWSGGYEDSWKMLVELSNAINAPDEALDEESKDPVNCNFTRCGPPADLVRLLHQAKAFSIPRQPLQLTQLGQDHSWNSSKGMSPKKFHEVSRMTAYVLHLLDDLRVRCHVEIHHIVDIGAGQGYLAKSLCDARDLHILALDSSRSQTEGSVRRSQQSKSKGTLTHKTYWLGERPSFETHPGLQGSDLETTDNLKRAINEWIYDLDKERNIHLVDGVRKEPVPILFVALHACGALTPSILQEALHHRQNQSVYKQTWFVGASVIVGCCYNLMRRGDFPLSRSVMEYTEEHYPSFELSSSHLQLAAQIPSQWFKSADAECATNLALKKILYRSLISPLLAQKFRNSEAEHAQKRLGKLNTTAYESFQMYLIQAGQKIGSDLMASYREKVAQYPEPIERTALASCIKTLHTLRCLLGPPVESLILLDRLLWLQEKLEGTRLDVQLVNLFDQQKGSGRNVAIVILPSST